MWKNKERGQMAETTNAGYQQGGLEVELIVLAFSLVLWRTRRQAKLQPA